MADETWTDETQVQDTAQADHEHSDTTADNAGVSETDAEALQSKDTQVENNDPTEETLADVRDTEDVTNDQDQVSGQNSPAAVVADERDFSEQAAAVALADESEWIADDDKAGEGYLYPENYLNAQNPPKNVIIAYKYEPTGEANNS